MNSLSFVRQTKQRIIANLIAGILLLATGSIMTILQIVLVNNKAIIGLSFIPLAIAFSGWLNLIFLRKYPKDMRSLIVSQNDERLVNERNAAEAKAFQIFRWLLNLVFIGYTLIVPADIFETVGWWTVLFFWAISHFLPVFFLQISSRPEPIDEE